VSNYEKKKNTSAECNHPILFENINMKTHGKDANRIRYLQTIMPWSKETWTNILPILLPTGQGLTTIPTLPA